MSNTSLSLANTSSRAAFETGYIPVVDPHYIKWGAFSDVESIIKSKRFYPVYIAGPSGNGKTLMVEQACAKAKREFVRVNLSPETDEDDLIGGFRLLDGNTVFMKGPVIQAMESGAVLLLDEADRATNKIMCLQSILEGKPILLKKTGEVISPAPGFTVIATANTNGRGSEDGRYTAASILDDAFLERFVITINQPWPTKTIEKKIVLGAMEKHSCIDEDFAEKLVTWTRIIRATYENDGIDDVVSTRRLDHIIQTFGIFNDRIKSITLGVNRFSNETSTAMVDLYTKIDAGELKDDTLPYEPTAQQTAANEPLLF